MTRFKKTLNTHEIAEKKCSRKSRVVYRMLLNGFQYQIEIEIELNSISKSTNFTFICCAFKEKGFKTTHTEERFITLCVVFNPFLLIRATI